MNKIVNNLAQIADAAEYFDRKTGAAWKIRGALTNMAVWACNSYLYAVKADNIERIARSMVEVSTLRSWVHDSNCNAFTLDLTPSAVARTLGLERVVDVHEEACRSARQKCIQTRSAAHFKKYYDAAIAAFEEQRRARQENVDRIANLLSDVDWPLSASLADHFETFMGMKFVSEASDLDLYDDQAVERQADQLAETVGNALEAMYDVCDAELAAAITAEKVARLTAYHRAINNMLVITGVDMKKLGERRAKLEAAIEAQISTATQSVKDIDASIAEQITAMADPHNLPDDLKAAKVAKAKVAKAKARIAEIRAESQIADISDLEAIIAANEVAPKKKMQRVKKSSLKELGELVK